MEYKDFILVLNKVVNNSNYYNIRIKSMYDGFALNEKTIIDGEIFDSQMINMLVNLLKSLKIEPDYDVILAVMNKVNFQDNMYFIYIEELYNYLNDNHLLNIEVIEHDNGIQYHDFEKVLLKFFPNITIDNMKMLVDMPMKEIKDSFNSVTIDLEEQFKRTFFMNIYEASTIEKNKVTKIDLGFLWIDSFKDYKTASFDVNKTLEHTNSLLTP
jgi:hypothetical protein